MEGVGGVEREGGLEGLSKSAWSVVRDEDWEEEGPVFVVEFEGVASSVEGVQGEKTGGGVGEIGENVNPHPIFSQSGDRPNKF